jgi:hypothetical protein
MSAFARHFMPDYAHFVPPGHRVSFLRLPPRRDRGTELKSLSVTRLVIPAPEQFTACHNFNSPWDSQPVWLSAVLFFALSEAFRRINSGYDEGRSKGRF